MSISKREEDRLDRWSNAVFEQRRERRTEKQNLQTELATAIRERIADRIDAQNIVIGLGGKPFDERWSVHEEVIGDLRSLLQVITGVRE